MVARRGQAIVNKVFFRQRSNLLDPEALEDAETTVRNMLRDYLESKNVPERVRSVAAASGGGANGIFLSYGGSRCDMNARCRMRRELCRRFSRD